MNGTTALNSEYPTVMQDVANRLIAAEESYEELLGNTNHPLAWKNCELIALQIRKICELMILGSTIAHWREGQADLNPKKWRPKEAFGELSDLSDHPLQVPVNIILNHNGPGQHHIVPISTGLPFKTLNSLYGFCGDVLHIPSAKKVVAGTIPPFEAARFKGWMDGFRRLLESHALLLPGVELVLLSTWGGQATNAVSVFLLSAQGESTLDWTEYPEFTLLQV